MKQNTSDGPVYLRTFGGCLGGFQMTADFPALTSSGKQDRKIITAERSSLTPARFSASFRRGEPAQHFEHVVGDG